VADRSARGTACRATAFVLDGEKTWISCGGFAGLLIVFANCDERRSVDNFQTDDFGGVGFGVETYQNKVDEQEALMHLADIVIDTCRAKSALLRTIAAVNIDADGANLTH